MKPRELEKLLAEAGYEQVRNGKHVLWRKGSDLVGIPKGSKRSECALRNIAKRVKRQRESEAC